MKTLDIEVDSLILGFEGFRLAQLKIDALILQDLGFSCAVPKLYVSQCKFQNLNIRTLNCKSNSLNFKVR